jgi:prevent-host-death family protein
MEEIGSFEARTHFSKLLRRIEEGEEFVVTMRGKPVASLTPVVPRHRPRNIADVLADFRSMRGEIIKRSPILTAGETWKDLGREGLKW